MVRMWHRLIRSSLLQISPFVNRSVTIVSRIKPVRNEAKDIRVTRIVFNSNLSSDHVAGKQKSTRISTLAAILLTTVITQIFLLKRQAKALVSKNEAESKSSTEEIIPGGRIENLKTYSLEEVAKHNDASNRDLWVVYKEGVYDISDFVISHPGGDVICLAAGNSIEPFWEVYPQHKTEQIYRMLESFRIGNLRTEDRLKSSIESGDIFDFIPPRSKPYISHHDKPYNTETDPKILSTNYYTPNEQFFVRNHLSVPNVDLEDYRLEIGGLGLKRTFTFTLDELKKFPKHTVTSVVQCAGNRRNELNQLKEVKGIPWQVGAIGNAKWSGVRLIDVLKHCEANLDHPQLKHVQMEGLDFDATSTPYGASIPADIALDPNGKVLLAYEMNGEPIPHDHGFPVRLIVPGVVGARNVKWLARVTLSDSESDSHWQKNDYKTFPANKQMATKEDMDSATPIQQLPVQSVVCVPADGEQIALKDSKIYACGYAYSGGGKDIIRVDVSIDGGKTWQEATLEKEVPPSSPNRTYSWSLWKIELPVSKKGELEIICRAFDSSHNGQPSEISEIWNFRGLLNNSYHRIRINLK